MDPPDPSAVRTAENLWIFHEMEKIMTMRTVYLKGQVCYNYLVLSVPEKRAIIGKKIWKYQRG